MTLSIIVAQGLNRAIGKDNKLLWHLPADLKFFKTTTTGHTIIMGRKTFESVGRPLPNRRNIVISRDVDYKMDGIEVYPSIDLALKACENEKEVFIVGGASIYEQVLSKVDKIYLTQVEHIFDADTFFPEMNPTEWKLIWEEEHKKNEKNLFDFRFQIFSKV